MSQSQSEGVWVKVSERLPTAEDADFYNEVLTIQVGRQRQTFMKYWELKDCPFTKAWMKVPVYIDTDARPLHQKRATCKLKTIG